MYLARHGETEWSLSGRHTGSTDLPLTTRGEERAAALRARLAGLQFAAVFSSPMQRARRTAELAGFPHPHVTDLLREFNYGQYEGLTSAEIRASQPGWEIYHHGCPGGESPADVYARAQQFLDLASSVAAGGGSVLAFAHGHILRAVAAAWLALDITAASEFRLDVATLSQLAATDRGRELALWNSP
ncbi:MAG TPA: histidine phosphatase family protein [Candidatus Polarisedimenticolia bacterium]|nr:histidine phosphatase family protein [Candidatus Polarisedimenticolia bacterium]